MSCVPAEDTASSRPRSWAGKARPGRGRLKLALLASTALIALTGVAPSARAQDSGNPCVMVGSACSIPSTGAPATPASGDGGNGGPGNQAPALSSTFNGPDSFTDDPASLTSPINMTAVGSVGAAGNSNSGGANFGQGGSGGAGGQGGDITLTVNSPGTGNSVTVTGISSSVASGVTVGSNGATGGGSALGQDNGGAPGSSGTGGAGGTVAVTLGGNFTSAAGHGTNIWSFGGTGGLGASGTHVLNKFGVDGGQGGDAGASVDVTLQGYLQGQKTGAYVQSAGGNGGQGGDGDSDFSGQGGNGGTGGNGGSVTVTVAQDAQIVGYGGDGSDGSGLWVQSVGGLGGQGGGGEIGGTGGQGGDAGSVVVTVNGQVTAAGGNGAPGVLAQSLGSVGGDGGHASDWSFNPTSGDGNNGGLANSVTVNGTGAVISAGKDTGAGEGGVSPAVLAQSIGGNGGIGPDTTGIFAVGGGGGDGAAGSWVGISLDDATIVSEGYNSAGLQAQSIGGGGGKGGDATSSGLHSGAGVNMTIGGTGGGGGGADDANIINNGGSVTTTDQHSPGISIQSIGGGGGDGGAAYSTSYSVFYGASLSVGGTGGGGGDGGTVNAANVTNNSGRILTSGSDSFGMLGQSIGGGGGSGGASTAKSIVKSPDDFGSMSLSMSSGGSGGSGGSSSAVFLQSTGLIATQGAGAIGIIAQSIGGGGGTGGDSSASSSATGGDLNLSAAISHGGSGGDGGAAGNARGENHGLVITTGESADGMLIQSIGGGGGAGGSGDAKSNTGADKSLSLALGMGGSAGGGGEGYNVSANNVGTIITLGDGARGMVEQTIGGGGGRAGGAAGSVSGAIKTGVSIGGTGGDGGDTFYQGSSSQSTNTGTILTFGADATGILAQSIGGGGGDGGKAGTTLGTSKSTGDGGNGGANNAAGNTISQVAADFASNGNALGNYITIQQALNTANAMLGNDSLSVADDEDIADELDDASGSSGETDDDNQATSIGINVGIGGKGGTGGAAGFITVNNTGTVATMGRHADAIVVQAIGGGGGKGGAASTASSADIAGNVAVGGSGGGSDKTNANNGGRPSVTNSGQVYTMGPLANGIVTQSIAGGGGMGGSSSATSGTSSSNRSVTLNISVGGGGGSGSISEAAQVTSSGAIETRGHDSIGIIAQSIAGGGGIVKTLATDLDTQGGSATASSTKTFAANIKIGNDKDSSSGNSGAALVTTQSGGTITTSGDDSYGILAQSISGGGGVAQGGMPNGSSASDFFGSGKMTGTVNPGLSSDPDANQGVEVEVGDAIQTSGRGAVGVFAQSIGGGGGIAGDVGYTMQKVTMGRDDNHSGNGGDILITVDQGASITTTGGPCVTGRSCGNAPGIIAQSIGGGGGWFTNESYAYIGSAGGTGDGGAVNIEVQGSIDAQGPASPGIFAQSVGGASNGGSGTAGPISINIGSASNTGVSVFGGNGFGDDAAAVRFDHGFSNMLTNYGTIDSHENDASSGNYQGTAVYSYGGFTQVVNLGTINGQIHMGSQTGTDTFTWGSVTNNGTINSGTDISLGAGALTNDGKLSIAGDGHIGTTTVMGNYVQGATGLLAIDADQATKESDRLEVTGDVTLGGTVAIASPTLTKDPLTILHGTGEVTVDPALAFNRTHVLSYTPQVTGGSVVVVPKADFHGEDGSLAGNREAVAQHLQQVFDRGEDGFGEGLAGLATDQDGGRYQDRLDSLTGETLAALGGLQMQSGRGFRSGLYSCPTFGDEGILLREQDCGWGQVTGSYADQNGSGSDLGYDVKSLTTQFGGQKQIAEGWFLGGSLAYQRSDLESDHDLTDIDGDGVLAGIVLKRQTGPLTLSAAADGGYGWYDSKRQIDLATGTENAKASPEAGNAGLHARASYELPFDRWYLKPSFEVGADYVRTGSFKEHGASPFDLDVDSEDKVILSATPGIELGGRIDLTGGSILRPHLELGLTATTANNWKPDARFKDESGSDSFRIESQNPNLIGHLGIGVDMITTASVDIKLQYGLDLADDYTANSGMLKAAYRF